jgi:hypothetical protein
LALAFLANMVLLVIGACYWRIVLCRIEGDGAPAKNWIPRIARAEPIAAILTAATVLATVSDSIAPAGGWTPERYAVAAMCTLAVLEYVNYYHFQLQYFDHWPDFAALVRRKTLRRSHMSLEIAEWRRSRA